MTLRLPLLSLALVLVAGLLAAGFNAAAGPPPAPPLPAPEGFARTPVGLVVQEPEAAPGYTLITRYPWEDELYTDQIVYLMDNDGRVVYRWKMDNPIESARLLENGNLLASGVGGRRRGGVREIDPAGRVVWQYRKVGQHHDFMKLPNGNVLMLAKQRKSAGEAIALGGDPDHYTEGLKVDYLLEVRPTGREGGEVVWEWSAQDHVIQDFDPGKPNYGVVSEHPERINLNYNLEGLSRWFRPHDWLHGNSIDYNPELDQVMLSVRHFSEVWIIDHSTTIAEAAGSTGGRSGRGGDLLYRWGNPRAWQGGTAAEQQLYFQHNAHWIKPGLPGAGNALIFNNGFEFPGSERFYSSVDEVPLPAAGYGYRLDPGAPYGPASPAWSYRATSPKDFYAPTMSGAQRLPNGNTLICDSNQGTIFEVTPQGKVVWKYINPVLSTGPMRQGDLIQVISLSDGRPTFWDNRVYRAYRYPPDYPGLQYLTLHPEGPVELAAE